MVIPLFDEVWGNVVAEQIHEYITHRFAGHLEYDTDTSVAGTSSLGGSLLSHQRLHLELDQPKFQEIDLVGNTWLLQRPDDAFLSVEFAF